MKKITNETRLESIKGGAQPHHSVHYKNKWYHCYYTCPSGVSRQVCIFSDKTKSFTHTCYATP